MLRGGERECPLETAGEKVAHHERHATSARHVREGLEQELEIGAGVLGYFLRLFDIDRTVVVLGLVLGPLVEKNFRLSLIISRGNPAVFFSTWADNAFWLVLLLFVCGPMLWHVLRRMRSRGEVQLAPATK